MSVEWWVLTSSLRKRRYDAIASIYSSRRLVHISTTVAWFSNLQRNTTRAFSHRSSHILVVFRRRTRYRKLMLFNRSTYKWCTCRKKGLSIAFGPMANISVCFGLLRVLCWSLKSVNGNQSKCKSTMHLVLLRRGFQLWNPFHSIWSTRAGRYASFTFLLMAALSSFIYLVCLITLVGRIFWNIRSKQRELSAMRRIRRLMYQVGTVKTASFSLPTSSHPSGCILSISIYTLGNSLLRSDDHYLVLFESTVRNQLGVGYRESIEASLFRSISDG